MSDTVHRGRSKEDANRPLTIRLTQEEYDGLKELAESLCRTVSGQVVWEIQRAIIEAEAIKEEARRWCPGDKLVGVCPGIESGVNSDCPKWKEEG